MKNKYTSLELSKKLYEAGFKENSKNHWGKWWDLISSTWRTIKAKYDIRNKDSFWFNPEFPAYDILNDLCVKYWKKLFGEYEYKKVKCSCHKNATVTTNKWFKWHWNEILSLLQSWNKQKAEDYLWENTLLNKSK